MAPRVDGAIRLRDGRRLAYTEWGAAEGTPVLHFHGTPGSRLWCPDEAATAEAGMRLVIPDRPGVGGSDPKPRRTFSDWVPDVVELTEALQISTFAVIGLSSGGPYAAACAALIPDRLTAVSIVSSRWVARYAWEERPGIEGEWDSTDRAEFEVARKDPDAAAALASANYGAWVADLADHPEKLHRGLDSVKGERRFFEDPAAVKAFDAGTTEAVRQGIGAVVWEFNCAYMPWGFRLADIKLPVRIWHGDLDDRVLQDDIDFQVRAIRGSTLVRWPDSGHLGIASHWGEILAAVREASG